MTRRMLMLTGTILFLAGPSTHAQTQGGGTTIGGGGATGGGVTSTGGGGGGTVGRTAGGGTTGVSSGNFGPQGGVNLGNNAGNAGGGIGGQPGARGAAGVLAYPSVSNPFRTTFANPLGMGMTGSIPSSAPKAAFGQPLFAIVTSTNVGGIPALGGDLNGGITINNGGGGFSTIGLSKAPPYVTTISDDFPLVQHPPTKIESDLRDVLQRSTSLKGKGNLAVTVEGPLVILRGVAPSDRERRLAESLIRLTPGVRDVRNEIEVAPANP